MRRRHHVALSTFLVLAILLLGARDADVTGRMPRPKKKTTPALLAVGPLTSLAPTVEPSLAAIIEPSLAAIIEPSLAPHPLAATIEPSSAPTIQGSTTPTPPPLDAAAGDAGHQSPLSPEESVTSALAVHNDAVTTPPPHDEAVTTPPHDDASAHKPELPFQQDLALELPLPSLLAHAKRAPHNYNPKGPKTRAYATFMATRNPSIHDPYFLAIHSLVYRILWSPQLRSEKYPFIVFVGQWVTQEQRDLLSAAGAIVRELAPLEWTPNVPGVTPRWRDLFAKLNMWKETSFERIVFLDADAFPMAKLDDMFDAAPLQNCLPDKLQPDDKLADGTPVCEPYLFAGAPQNPMSADDTDFNAGVIVFTPSERMYQRLLQNYVKTDNYDCLLVEQAFLNWQFSPHAAFPATILPRKWGAVFPQADDEGKLNVVHEKIWVAQDGWLQKNWVDLWIEMVRYYESEEFGKLRSRASEIS